MTSIRHTPSPNRVADDVLLDAAMECVLSVGVRRTTLSDVARTASVSRMTLYRRFPDVRGMLSALITREFGKILAEANRAAAQEPTARGQLVVASVHTIRALADNPLMHAVIERDAEMLLPYIMERIGTSQRMTEEFVRAQLAAGRRDGSIRDGDPAVQARSIFLLLQPYVFAIRPSTSDLPLDALLTELAHVLDVVLRP
ncbi:TetR/AcrR family transcriptional regulator [Actinophytocola gossypii]|uniref:TetR/AcrR family transcriptional regulator n=1 Tax=Actinophytocola gossypii TaxID=2812003 RepID=A0ABT2J4P5_9PSEU|nr:TetR/AcrR family transcriptional regulator [Actinophytocola gossypii]MCT2582753.1 TetR/AcrR family transcriptional regulator [Actinophytocola gossypii]